MFYTRPEYSSRAPLAWLSRQENLWQDDIHFGPANVDCVLRLRNMNARGDEISLLHIYFTLFY